MLLLEAFWQDFRARGLAGVTVTGATAPAGINGAWWPAMDAYGVAAAYANDAYQLWYDDAEERWLLGVSDSNPALFTRDDPDPAGAYVAGEGSGTLVVSIPPVRWGEREGTDEQIVISQHGILTSRDVPGLYDRFSVLIDVWHRNRRIAELRAQAIFQIYHSLTCRSTSASGLTLTGWQALFVSTDHLGVLDAEDITGPGKQLYRAAVDVTFEHVVAT